MPYFVGCGTPDVIHDIPESSPGKVTWVTFAELFHDFHVDICHFFFIKTLT